MTKQIENIQTQSTAELMAQKVRDILVRKKVIEDMEKNMTVHYIKEGVFAWHNGRNVAGFLKEDGESIVMLLPITKDPMFVKAAFLAGYREIKQSNGVYNLYHMQDIDEKTGQAKSGAKPLDVFSVEYFQAWMDIWFYLSEIVIRIWKNGEKKEDFAEVTQDMIDEFTETKTLRIRDIEFFLKHKQINKKLFDKTLKVLQSQILGQIGDNRFYRVGDEITFDELRGYYERGYLDKKLYEQTIKILGEVEAKRLERDKKKDALKEKTKGEIKKVR